MNTSESNIDDGVLDRLVDGELSPDERRQVLLALEAEPNGWRRCALAFVEAQSWGATMRSMLDPPPSKGGDRGGTIELASSVEPRSSANSRLGTLLAIAASIAVAFGLGWRMNQADFPVKSPGEQIASVPANVDENGDALTLVVHDSAGNPQRVRVPLVEGSRLGDQFADAPGWSAPVELRQQLGKRGLDLATRRRYAPMFFEQQDKLIPMVVPVDDAVITPVSSKVY